MMVITYATDVYRGGGRCMQKGRPGTETFSGGFTSRSKDTNLEAGSCHRCRHSMRFRKVRLDSPGQKEYDAMLLCGDPGIGHV